MRYVRRTLDVQLHRAAKAFASVVLTGPRRSGKTMLLRRALPDASYHLFEDPDVVARFRADPQGFLDAMRLPAILDEVQYAPALFRHLKLQVDKDRQACGRFLLSGSQPFTLMQEVGDSLAGRAAILQLTGLSTAEIRAVDPDPDPETLLLRGGFPELHANAAIDAADRPTIRMPAIASLNSCWRLGQTTLRSSAVVACRKPERPSSRLSAASCSGTSGEAPSPEAGRSGWLWVVKLLN